jgi:hypothetical protein
MMHDMTSSTYEAENSSGETRYKFYLIGALTAFFGSHLDEGEPGWLDRLTFIRIFAHLFVLINTAGVILISLSNPGIICCATSC